MIVPKVWSNKISLNSEGCINCEPGYYSDTLGATDSYTCTICNSGKFNSYYGAVKETDCILASLGKYSLSGYRESISCPIGKYSNNLGSSACSFCEIGKYADEQGTIYCKDCPANSIQNVDKTSWICDSGSYEINNNSYRECKICPENTICNIGSTIETITLEEGYRRKDKYSLSIIKCRKSEYCIGGVMTNNTSICRKGHRGILCDSCEKGYAKTGGLCEICPETSKSVNILLSLFFVLISLFCFSILN